MGNNRQLKNLDTVERERERERELYFNKIKTIKATLEIVVALLMIYINSKDRNIMPVLDTG